MILLKDVGNITMGQSPKSETYNTIGEGLPFFQGKADFGILHPKKRIWCTASKKEAHKNDLLISVRAPVGALNIALDECSIGRGLAAISINANNDTKYIYYNLCYLKPQLQQQSTGSTFDAINKAKLEKLVIKKRSLSEQVKIRRILDSLSEQIQIKLELLNHYDMLIKSRFIELFGDPNNPYNVLWPIVPISKVTDCMVPGRDKPKSFTGTIPWITIDDLIVNNTTEKSKNNIGLTVDEIKSVKRKCIPSGSIIMSCVGNLGLCSISACELVINQQLHSFQCKSMVDNFYLMYYLSFLKGYMNKMATNTTVLYMNKTVCNSIPVILPPIELQHKFSKFLNKINKLKFAIMVYN